MFARKKEKEERTGVWDSRKKWLKICKPTSARSVTRGGRKARERQCIVGTRTSRVSCRQLGVEDVFYVFAILRELTRGIPCHRELGPIFVSSSEDKHGETKVFGSLRFRRKPGFICFTFRSISAGARFSREFSFWMLSRDTSYSRTMLR